MWTSQALFNTIAMILSIQIGLFTMSCTASSSTTRFLVNQPDRTVGMEITYRDGSPEFSHPINLRPRVLEQALLSMEVQPSSLLDRIAGTSSLAQEAFTKEQREFLADQLSTAFREVTPLETVTFHWSTSRGNGIWEITSGGLYLQENQLHLILPNYRHTVSAQHQSQKLRNQPLSPLGEPQHSLKVKAPTQQLKHDLLTELWAPHTPHFVFDLHRLTNTPLISGNQLTESSTTRHTFGSSIKQRLKRLEELQQEGLLSDNEYQNKRQKILDKL